jgi:HSP20 family molecular chaperone IbpA
LFEVRGREIGRDVDDWLKAEQELLQPVPLEITEQDKVLNIRAKIPGFSAGELKINLEPWALTITGTQEKKSEKQEQKTKVHEWRRKRICRTVSLPAAILPEKATVTLNEGILEIKAEKTEPAVKVEVTAA